ncbi:hypothetical protein [Lysinibacillus xylanilyticus]|uniref:hypothetical protein n=1 Tax=Lysinibacillus xylanilyticus TaxID=582475 RepID=UPI003CFFE97F
MEIMIPLSRVCNYESIVNYINNGISMFKIGPTYEKYEILQLYSYLQNASKYTGKSIQTVIELPAPYVKIGEMMKTNISIGDFLIVGQNNGVDYEYMEILMTDFAKVLPYINKDTIVSTICGKLIFEIQKINENNTALFKCIKKCGHIRKFEQFYFPNSNIPSDNFRSTKSIITSLGQNNIRPDYFIIHQAEAPNAIVPLVTLISSVFGKESVKVLGEVDFKNKFSSNNLYGILDGFYLDREKLMYQYNPFILPEVQDEVLIFTKQSNKIAIVANGFFNKFSNSGIISRPEISDILLLLKQKVNVIELSEEIVTSKYFTKVISYIKEMITEYKV